MNSTDSGGSGVAQIQYALSGASSGSQIVPGATASVSITANGTTILTYFAVDNAGNIESSHMLTVNIDSTLPVIVPSVSGTEGAAGWYVSNVTVSWTVTDPYSGIALIVGLRAGHPLRIHRRQRRFRAPRPAWPV